MSDNDGDGDDEDDSGDAGAAVRIPLALEDVPSDILLILCPDS